MVLKVKTFGITRDILGGRMVEITPAGTTVGDLRRELAVRYPGLAALNSLLIAVNREYAQDITRLSENDEIALIPPVSGG